MMFNWRAVSSTLRYPRFSSLHSISLSIALYITALATGTALFFFLHYLANQIPHDLALQRLRDEYASNLPYTGAQYPKVFSSHVISNPHQYCKLSMAVIAGARDDESNDAFVDAVMLKTMEQGSCNTFRSVMDGDDAEKALLEPRYWWGTKALYSIALRHLTVLEYLRVIKIATYSAYILLAAALLLNGWRALLVTSPLLLFGLLIPAIGYFSDISNGVPYLWALISTSVLGFLVWRNSSMRVVKLFCFIMGMVSSYIWIFDGSNFLAVTLIGMVVWLCYQQLNPIDRARRAVGFIMLYTLGFISCFALGQATKAIVYEHRIANGNDYLGGYVADTLFARTNRTINYVTRNASADLTEHDYCHIMCPDSIWHRLPVFRHIPAFWSLSPMSTQADMAMGVFSVLALLTGISFASFNIARGQPEAMWHILFLAGIMLIVCLKFFLPDDIPFRTVRFVSLLLALCWSCLIVATLHMKPRIVLITCIGFILAWSTVMLWWGVNARSTTVLTRGTETVVDSYFNVYIGENKLIFLREDCSSEDVTPKFFLHIDPADVNTLPDERQKFGFDNLDFHLPQYTLPLLSERRLPFLNRCAASIDLPQYSIESIRTGQFNDEGQIWNESFVVQDSIAR